MSLISLPYTFSPGTTIASAQVNADFAAIVNVVNGNLDSTNFSTVLSSSNFAKKGHVTIAGGLILQWDAPSTVPFDNASALAVVFDIAFPNAVLDIQLTVNQNTQNAPHAGLVCAYFNTPTTTGFNITAMGGSAAQTGTVHYLALGY